MNALFVSSSSRFPPATSFSEQDLMDCGWGSAGVACSGGNPQAAMDFVIQVLEHAKIVAESMKALIIKSKCTRFATNIGSRMSIVNTGAKKKMVTFIKRSFYLRASNIPYQAAEKPRIILCPPGKAHILFGDCKFRKKLSSTPRVQSFSS